MADNEERFKPEWRDFEKRFQDQMWEYLQQIKGLPADERAKTENLLRDRFRREEKETAELEEKEPDFYNPSTQGKHMSLNEFLHFDAGQIVKNALKDRPSDFEGRFSRIVLEEYRDKLETLPPEKRAQVVDKLRERFREYEEDPHVNDEKQLLEFFKKWQGSIDSHWADSERIVTEACGESQGASGTRKSADQNRERAQKLRDELNARMDSGKPHDHDRER
jgi:hypothetical protein